MRQISGSRNRERQGALLLLLSLIALAITVLGWQSPPWSEQVRVHRSEFHRAKIPYIAGMRVRDAVQQSLAILGKGKSARESVVLYRWRCWLPERIADGAVVSMQCALHTLGVPQWSSSLWTWWDARVPRQSCWREIARDERALELLVHPGELIILSKGTP